MRDGAGRRGMRSCLDLHTLHIVTAAVVPAVDVARRGGSGLSVSVLRQVQAEHLRGETVGKKCCGYCMEYGVRN